MIVKINVHLNLNVTQCIIVLKPYIIPPKCMILCTNLKIIEINK